MARLTKKAIDAIAPQERRFEVWDDAIPGLYLRVEPSGLKTFYLFYRTALYRQRRLKLGAYGVLTLEQARELARSALVAVSAGKDPAGDRQEARRSPTVADLAARYLAEVTPGKAPSTVVRERVKWNKHIIPRLQSLRVVEVSQADIARFHRQVSESSGLVNGNRVLATLSHAFTMAERWGWRPAGSNPCRGVEVNREPKRKGALSAEHVVKLGAALDALAGTGDPADWMFAAQLRLLLLTGARRSEWQRARVEDVDLASCTLRVPANKEGNPDKTIPLPPDALAIASQAVGGRASGWLFPSPKNPAIPFTCIDRRWWRLQAEIGLPRGTHLHDLRHTFASLALSLGYSLEVIGGVLGHSIRATTERYAYLLDDQRRVVLANIGEAVRNQRKK